MGATRNGGPARNKAEAFGLLANGSSGPWEIAIDEHLGGADRWRAQMEGPLVSFNFEIQSLQIISKMAQFFGRASAEGSLLVGGDRKTPVTLVRDDEYKDRFFLVVGPTANPIVRFVIAGADVEHISSALRQVIADMEEAD